MVHRLLMRHDDVPQVQGVAAGEVDQRTATQTTEQAITKKSSIP